MIFGTNYKTGPERVADSIIKNINLDTSPSKRTILGSESAVLNLRPVEQERQIGKPGKFRMGPQSN